MRTLFRYRCRPHPAVALSEELAGVQDRIARTDDLIDQIVYCLYGLTEEEIAIVEGRT